MFHMIEQGVRPHGDAKQVIHKFRGSAVSDVIEGRFFENVLSEHGTVYIDGFLAGPDNKSLQPGACACLRNSRPHHEGDFTELEAKYVAKVIGKLEGCTILVPVHGPCSSPWRIEIAGFIVVPVLPSIFTLWCDNANVTRTHMAMRLFLLHLDAQRWLLVTACYLWHVYREVAKQRGIDTVRACKVKTHATQQGVDEGAVAAEQIACNHSVDNPATVARTLRDQRYIVAIVFLMERQQGWKPIIEVTQGVLTRANARMIDFLFEVDGANFKPRRRAPH